MITGVVKSDEGRIRLKVKVLRGWEQDVEAVIDTGHCNNIITSVASLPAAEEVTEYVRLCDHP
jgi:hypothetical protein